MAETSIVNGTIEYIKVGNTTNAIASTAYGYCETAAGTAIKNVLMTGFKLETGVTVHIKFANTNSAANPKLKFNGEADANAKAIMQYGTTAAGTGAATTGWYAGAVVTLTYDGTNWIRDQGFNTNTTYSYMRPYETTGKGSYSSQGENPVKTGSAGWKFQLTAGKYFMYSHYYDNTAQSALTLNIGSTGAKPIYINGQPSSASNYTLPGGQYLVYYDGTNYHFRTDDKIPGNITGDAATVNGHTVEKNVPSNAVFTDTKSFTITANATDGYWDLIGTNGTNAVTYALTPYSSKQSGANFYTGSTNPDGNTRLNYNGYLYASKLYSNGTEVSVNGHNHDSAYSAIHQTSWDWASDGTKPLSKYVTFDANIVKGNAEKAPEAGWYNGFVTSHDNYLASFILNKHRTDKWYVGWEQYPKDGSTTYTEPTWYLLAHSGNVQTGDNNGQVKIAGVNIGVKGLAALAYKANLAWDEITQTGADNLPEGNSNWTDNTEILTSYASNNGFADTNAKGKIYRRDAIAAWNYINGKAASVYAKLASPAFSGTPTAPTAANGTSTTQIATTEFVNNTLAYANAMTFKGTLGTGGTITALPASHNAGDTYRVITAGTWAGKYCEVGTLIICTTDGTTANDAHWTSVETNEDGAVIGPTSSTNLALARFDGTTGRIIKNSTVQLSDGGALYFKTNGTALTANPGINWSDNGTPADTATSYVHGSSEGNIAINALNAIYLRPGNGSTLSTSYGYIVTNTALYDGDNDGTKDLGSTTRRWQNVYSKNFVSSGGSLKFIAGSQMYDNKNIKWINSADTTDYAYIGTSTAGNIGIVAKSMIVLSANSSASAYKGDLNSSVRINGNSLFSNTTNDYSLGTSDSRWKNIYSQTAIYVGGTSFTTFDSNTQGTYICPGGIGLSNTTAGQGVYLRGGNIQYARMYISTIGTAPTATTTDGVTTYSGYTAGEVLLTLGNDRIGGNSASGVAHNARGRLRLFGINSKYIDLIPESQSANHTFWLPNTTDDSAILIASYDQSGAIDLNTKYNAGIYCIEGGQVTNYPSGSTAYANLLVLPYRKPYGNSKPDYAVQIYGHSANRLWFRGSSDSTWRDWRELAHIAANTAVGSSTVPVYVTTAGEITSCTYPYVKVYNTANIGNSSTVTVNDLAASGNAVAMINHATDNPLGSAKWVHVLSMNWSNSATTWISQIAVGAGNGKGLYYRTNASSSIVGKAWMTVLDSDNYSSFISAATSQFTAPELIATRKMVVSAGKIYSDITGSNVQLTKGTARLFGDGLAISNPTTANDVGWIRVLGTGESDTVLEIATGDDGGTATGEKIVVRQYNTSNAVAKEAVLLDKQTSATSFPVSVTAPSFIGNLNAAHTAGGSQEIRVTYSTTIDYWWGVGTANENHGLYDNKANKWIILSGADNKWSFDGNASSATRINGNLGALTDTSQHNIWISSTNSADGIPKYVTGVYVTASTGVITAKGFSGPLSGNATTATAATAINFTASNELILGNADGQAKIYINHRRVIGGQSSGNTAITDYYFRNGNASESGVTIHADSFSGNAATASKISAKLAATTKTYLLGTTTTITATAANVEITGDTGVYLTTTAGELSAARHSWNVSGTEKAYTVYNTTDDSIDFVFI